ncbi:DEAD/DEAH box helicase [Pseudomonas sp. LJDD11]|uniref:DEAD/DEAH box helicase n=1 Tax=Pseudomonas sp. LJDD11 TaxID=2931984 RepID=UPI00211BE3A5|nr:DEAD/DEAH box helicase [Pseudomonas sp. LJDD11]MCQ9422306.1 DEAD/DEAH box helicase [Pseudomonas sp. LJDD11]
MSTLLKRSAPSLLKAAVYDGYDYGLLLTYLEGGNKVLLARQGFYIRRSEHPLYRAWRIPKHHLHHDPESLFAELKALAATDLRETAASFIAKLDAARAQRDSAAFTWGMHLRLAPLLEGGVLASGDYHPGVVAVYKRMGGIYLSQMRAWKLASSAEVVKLNLIEELGFADEQIEVLNTVQELHSDGSLSSVRSSDGIRVGGEFPEADPAREEGEGAKDLFLASVSGIERTPWTEARIAEALQEYSLYDYQHAGVRHLLLRNSALLADDMGLGKTRQAVVAAEVQAAGRPIMVVCLLSLIINWEREILAVNPQARIARQRFDSEAQWVLVNYERLGEYLQTAGQFAVLVIDEAHRLKEPTALWTRHAFDIAAQVPNRYLLTGTPVLNREIELHTLLRLSGHAIGQMPLKAFCKQFTGSTEFRQALRAQLSDWMLRRRKDVLTQLKGKQRQTLSLAMSAEQREQYDAIYNGSESALARIGKLRILLERFKLASVLQMVQELDIEDKVIIFCEFKDSVFTLRDECQRLGIDAVTLIGSDSFTKRQKVIDRFQNEADTRVFIGTTSAAGTGNNLTAANYVIFASLPWTPALQDQAEDRAYRNGQLRLVVVKIPMLEDTIDQQLWAMLEVKRAVAKDLVELDSGRAEAAEALAQVIATEA